MVPDPVEMLTTQDGVTLEASLRTPLSLLGGVVICHPHPLYGGDMENPVVVRIDEVCGTLGLATLRFNFRGVGRSTGVFGEGIAERLDVEAGLARLSSVVGAGRPVAVAGYSFGAGVVGGLAPEHSELAGVVLVAPPLARMDPSHFAPLARFGPRLLVVAGTKDEICPPEGVARLADMLPRASVQLIDGANHFFFGKLYPLGEALATWARACLLP
jgi:alpha/beta superfamily hydrolase